MVFCFFVLLLLRNLFSNPQQLVCVLSVCVFFVSLSLTSLLSLLFCVCPRPHRRRQAFFLIFVFFFLCASRVSQTGAPAVRLLTPHLASFWFFLSYLFPLSLLLPSLLFFFVVFFFNCCCYQDGVGGVWSLSKR